MAVAFLALDSNLCDREQYLINALKEISTFEQTSILKISNIWEGYPVGLVDQENFLNIVAKIQTNLEPITLLKKCIEIEKKFKREPGIRWGPRTINVDLLLYDNFKIKNKEIQIPHQDIWKSAFILVPLRDIYDGEYLFKKDLNRLIDDIIGINYVKITDDNENTKLIAQKKEWGYIWKKFSLKHFKNIIGGY